MARSVAALMLVLSGAAPLVASAQACTGNAIVCENQNPGSAQPNWDIAGSGDPSIQGFGADISYNKGDTAVFKINTPASAYKIDIYRMGYYQGNGARKITSITPSASLPQTQPACLSDANTGLVDCGNWAPSASWAIPTTAVSGIYFALLTRTDTGGVSHIVFIVRDDSSTSQVLFQTDDPTWEAYNEWGGNSVYKGNGPGGGSQPGRAYKASYNRPFATRGQESGYGASNFVFYGEYPTVRWLESNGYDVSYFAGMDTDRRGALLKNHKVFLSVAHDEYWSAGQRANVEAARDAGVNLAFLSGNELYWKTRWENSTDPSNTPYRTMVTYKESLANGPIDPKDPTTWTGLWRDPRFSPPADGGRPENGLTGTIFMVNRGSAAIQVPSTYAKMRLWRNTPVANLTSGTATLGTQTLGYEWDVDLDNSAVPNVGPAARPAGLMDLSSTTVSGVDYLQDYGSTTATQTATHHLTMYRAPSGALVFGAGTVQWVWGLDVHHDTDADTGPTTPNATMQQATVNLLADMGAQPTTLQSGLVGASASTDSTPPTSVISSPTNGASVAVNSHVTVSGTATDAGGGVVGGVEVSVDGGTSWHPASGTNSWSYAWTPNSGGTWTVESRATDDSGNIQSPPAQVSVTVTGDSTPPIVSGVTSAVSANSATINWTTNEPSTSQIQYGTTTAYGTSTTLDPTLVTNHSQTISGLTAATTYDFRILSKDNTGNQTTTANFTFSTTVPASLVRVGDQTIEANVDSNTTGAAEASQYTATTTGSATRLSLYVDSSSTASAINVGLYTDSSNNPGTLLAQGNLASPVNGSWNNVPITSVNITSGTKYWIAVLAPQGATGTIGFRDVVAGGNTKVSSQTTLSTLPTTWTTGSSWSNAPMSAYAANLSGSSDTTPPTVSVTAPASGATVSGTAVSLTASASDNVGVTSVQFLLDGSALGAPITTSPYTLSWDSTTASNGAHTIGAQASDAAGNVGNATGVSVTVSNVDSVPPTISAVTTAGVTATQATITWTTNKVATSQVDYGTTTAYGTSTTLDPTLVVSHSQTLKNLIPATTYHYRVDSKNASGFGASSADFTLTTAAAPACPCTIWPTTATPTVPSVSDNQGLEIGVKFRSDNDGYVTGIRFYKGAGNTGTHIGNLWTIGGANLGTATFSNETASGWQQVNFASPIQISGNTDYVASYHTTTSYAADSNYFSGKGVDNGTLHALADGVDGGDGVYNYGATSTFPNQTYSASNYWVDLVFNTSVPPPPPPLAITAGPSSTGITSTAATITWTTNNTASSQVFYGTTTAYGSNTTLDSTLVTSHSQALGGLAPATLYHYSVQSRDSTNTLVSSADATFTTAAAPACTPCSLWAANVVPTNPSTNDPAALELGVKFRSDSAGYVTGLRFYKSSGNTGTHVGNVWTSTGTLLGTATFTSETASGWQQVTFPGGIQVSANTVYVASYHTNTGFYAGDAGYFTGHGVDNGILHAPADGVNGGNGVYVYSASSAFPNQTYSATNYWVDVVFSTTAPTLPPLTVTNVQATGVGTTSATVSWTTNNPATSQVFYGTSAAYGSSTTLSSTMVTSHSQALTGLTSSTTYHYQVQSKDASNTVVSSPDATFTTTAATTCPCSIWPTGTPVQPSVNDPSAVEVGLKFTADINGYIVGARFYKGASNTGTHQGTLWSATGTKLATATFANETASGWQTVTFSSPVAVTANTIYVVSYHTNVGFYAGDSNAFASAGVDNGDLHALSNAAASGNGVYTYGAVSTFPNHTFASTNYWVDVVFKQTLP